jgi:D-proline reductase (dithiol) PrdB
VKPLHYIDLVSSVTSELPPLPIADLGPPALRRPAKRLRDSRIMIVTSAGVRLKAEPAFKPVNDMTFRTIASGTPAALLAPSHPTPVRRPGERDINVVFPYERLQELAGAGVIGAVTPYHVSFLGTIKKLTSLVTELAMDMLASAREGGADAALLVPL